MPSPIKLAVLSLALLASAAAFHTSIVRPNGYNHRNGIFMKPTGQHDSKQGPRSLVDRLRLVKKAVASKVKPFGLGLLTAASICLSQVQSARAATPLPKSATMPDAEKAAMRSVQIEMEKKQQKESEDYNRRARQIEAKEGAKAREIFEKEYREAKDRKDNELLEELEELQRSLLDRGIDPFTDIEGYRQCFLLKTGKNLAEIEGTDQFADAQMEKMGYTKQTYASQKATNRQIIKLMVEDYKKRGIDPLPEFSSKDNQQMHARILSMPKTGATKKLLSMQENLAKYGQIDAPKSGEASLKEKMATDPEYALKMEEKLNKAIGKTVLDPKEAAAAAKTAAKAKAAEQKERVKAEKLKAKEEAKVAKLKAKEETRMAREAEQAKKRLEKEKANAEKEAAAAAASAGVGAATTGQANYLAAEAESGISQSPEGDGALITSETAESAESTSIEDYEDDSRFKDEFGVDVVENSKDKSLPVGKIGGLVAVAVGGKFVLDRISQQRTADEEERQRQFKLLMGLAEDEDTRSQRIDTSGAIDADSSDLLDFGDVRSGETNGAKPDEAAPGPQPAQASTPVSSPTSKKRGLGIKSMFTKSNKNNRETDLNVLVSPEATVPEFATLLAKLLTFGAPGRFPRVIALPGDMPMEEFQLERAKQMLEHSAEKLKISREQAAEIFADVVNCMIIDIIDLASSSLQEESSKTFDAINIVLDFTDHAASLYDAVAEGVVINPVTYAGGLPKSKLEQMFGAYAFTGMMKMDENATNRVELLRSIFAISEKKAEGIIMKASQKNMMEMMKTEEGRAEVEQMMGQMMEGMGGMEGMEGLSGMMGGEGEPSPEQLKEMLTLLKTMKESGNIPPEELATVREQFRESFGSSIDDMMKQADSEQAVMSADEKELLDLMKYILED